MIISEIAGCPEIFGNRGPGTGIGLTRESGRGLAQLCSRSAAQSVGKVERRASQGRGKRHFTKHWHRPCAAPAQKAITKTTLIVLIRSASAAAVARAATQAAAESAVASAWRRGQGQRRGEDSRAAAAPQAPPFVQSAAPASETVCACMTRSRVSVQSGEIEELGARRNVPEQCWRWWSRAGHSSSSSRPRAGRTSQPDRVRGWNAIACLRAKSRFLGVLPFCSSAEKRQEPIDRGFDDMAATLRYTS